MNDFSIPMALVDYIPVMLFALSAVILMRDLYRQMSPSAFALFATGTINVTCAGALKATYKLLYAANICDFQALSTLMFPMQSIGFLLAGSGALMLLCRRARNAVLSAAPPVFSGTFLFVGLMVAGLGMMDAVLCILAAKLKKPWLIAIFAVSFLCSLGMGYLSSQNFAQAAMNWIAECVNAVSQGALFAGVVLLHKSGLADLNLGK